MRLRLVLCFLLFWIPLQGQDVSAVQHGTVSASTPASPALWHVQGSKGRVYLFGTIHVMDKGTLWRTDAERKAFAESANLYLEIAQLDEASTQAAQPQILALGMDADHPLSTKLNAADLALLDGELKKAGLPGEQTVEKMQPWLVYMTLSVLPALRSGFDPASGIDRNLLADAVSAGKPVQGFETVLGQVHLLADIPQAEQIALLHRALADEGDAPAKMQAMVADWRKGDVAAIARMDNDDLRVKEPALYKRLLVDRNRAFTTAIEGMLAQPGTSFVAVGAAHLAGPDSVIAMLEAAGYKVVRDE